jgi:hypothetical protein
MGGSCDARTVGREAGVLPPFDIAWENKVPFAARLSIFGLVSGE